MNNINNVFRNSLPVWWYCFMSPIVVPLVAAARNMTGCGKGEGNDDSDE